MKSNISFWFWMAGVMFSSGYIPGFNDLPLLERVIGLLLWPLVLGAYLRYLGG